jgi:hypothetical protein
MRSRLVVLRAILTAAVCLVAATPSAEPADKQKLRSIALYVIGVGGVWAPGIAAYCDAHVEKNPPLVRAAAEWRKRNREDLSKAIEVLHWSGGMTKEQKDSFNRSGAATVKREVEAEADRAAYCRRVADAMNSGRLDLDMRPDTAKMLQVLSTDALR